MSNKNLKIIYMGTPEFAVAPLKALVCNGFDVAAVVTVPDKPQGRGLKLGQSAVKEYALSAGLPVLQPVKLKAPEFLAQLNEINADLFIVVAFRMLPAEVWKMPRLGTFNLHASLLPKYRGAAPINWAIINGETETGVTTFLIDEQIDTGKILMQERIAIEPSETVGTLYDKLMGIGADLVVKTVIGLAEDSITPYSQDSVLEVSGISDISTPDKTICTLPDAPKLNRDNCSINWKLSAKRIELIIRGLSPYPAAISTIKDNSGKETGVKIFMAEADKVVGINKTDNKNSVTPGTIKSDGKSYLAVVCGDGTLLQIKEIQLAGKKRISIKEFLAGFRNPNNHYFI